MKLFLFFFFFCSRLNDKLRWRPTSEHLLKEAENQIMTRKDAPFLTAICNVFMEFLLYYVRKQKLLYIQDGIVLCLAGIVC